MNELQNRLCMGCMSQKEGNPCPRCGFDETDPFNPDYLKPGSTLDSRYIVGNLQRYNGEGATYLGFDTQRNKPVWIIEYFPLTISERNTETGDIIPVSGRGAQYKALLADFMELCNEVRRLSVSDPVVPVDNMIGANNTVYIIKRHLDVITLEEYLIAKGGRLPFEEALELLIPLLNAVDNIHVHGVIHRGLSPYTVLVDNKGKMYIDGFALGATRTGGSELKAEFFNGYSAPEQYVSTGWQGTWTDVYAVATIFYRAISGIVPPKSTRISSQNPLKPLKDLVVGVPEKVSDAVENAMKILAQERTQTVVAFLNDLTAEDGVDRTAIFDPGRSISASIPRQPEFSFASGDDSYGKTAEIKTPQGFQEFKSEYKNNNGQRNIQQPGYNGYSNQPPPPLNSQQFQETPQVSEKGPKRRWAFVLALASVLLIGVVLAIIISGKMDLNTKREDAAKELSSQQEVSVGDEEQGPSIQGEENTTVPNFIGKELKSVQYNKEYTDKYKLVIEEEYSDKYKDGVIFDQSVKAGSALSDNNTIVLTVSKGNFELEMPDLSGKEQEEALQELAKLAQANDISFDKLVVSEPIKKIDDTRTEGSIISTIPMPGQKFNPEKTKIQFIIAAPSTVHESTQTPSSVPESSAPVSSKPESSKPESSRPSSSRPRGDNQVDESPNKPPSRN